MTGVRVRAVVGIAGELLLVLDAYLAAVLDTRPLASHLLDFAAWLGSTWRRHLAAARVRTYGPGRGVVAVITRTSPRSPRPNGEEMSGE